MLCAKIINDILKQRKPSFEFNLARIRNLLSKLGDPHKKLGPIIHIAGTNGKGSTSAFCRAILEASGAKVNLYSSPHLVNWNERFRIHGKLIDERELADLITDIAAFAETDISLFEILTVSAMLLFQRHHADYNIFEVGLGGRLDATNVIERPACSIITPISFDHCKLLGYNLSDIAFEKAGIIKNNCPVIIGAQEPAILKLLQNIALSKNAPYFSFSKDFLAISQNNKLLWQDRQRNLTISKPKLAGKHQIINAASAIKAACLLQPNLAKQTIEMGITKVYWPGRLQKITSGTIYHKFKNTKLEIWLDGAHNVAGAQTIVEFFKPYQAKILLIWAMLNTKDASAFFTKLKELNITSYNVPISNNANSIPTSDLARISNDVACNSLNEALEHILSKYKHEKAIILLTGSLHLVGEFLQLNGTEPK